MWRDWWRRREIHHCQTHTRHKLISQPPLLYSRSSRQNTQEAAILSLLSTLSKSGHSVQRSAKLRDTFALIWLQKRLGCDLRQITKKAEKTYKQTLATTATESVLHLKVGTCAFVFVCLLPLPWQLWYALQNFLTKHFLSMITNQNTNSEQWTKKMKKRPITIITFVKWIMKICTDLWQHHSKLHTDATLWVTTQRPSHSSWWSTCTNMKQMKSAV